MIPRTPLCARKTDIEKKEHGNRIEENRFDFHFGVQPEIQCVEDFDSSFKGDTEVFVSFIAQHLGLVHVESQERTLDDEDRSETCG
jgi:hypothetical protein